MVLGVRNVICFEYCPPPPSLDSPWCFRNKFFANFTLLRMNLDSCCNILGFAKKDNRTICICICSFTRILRLFDQTCQFLGEREIGVGEE